MSLALEARLKLCYGAAVSKTLVRSLSPDDIPPRGFSLRGYAESGCFVYEARCSGCSGEDVLTLASILNEVILLSAMVQKVFKAAERGDSRSPVA